MSNTILKSQNELSTARTAQIALWDETLEVKRSRLKPEEYEKLQSVADFATFRSTLQGLVDTHTQKRSSKIIQSLTPFLEHLRSLTAAIASLLKNTAIPAADLMWGVFQAVIQGCLRYSFALDSIINMLSEICKDMPRFEEYLNLFPESPTLESAMRAIFSDYVDFCLDAISFFKQRTASVLIQFIWGKRNLERTSKSIQMHKTDFNLELKLVKAKAMKAEAEETKLWRKKLVSSLAAGSTKRRFRILVPMSRNKFFFGRKEELQKMHEFLNPQVDEEEVRSCALYGIGGIGKTQTALEYAYKYKDSFSVIIWLRAESDPTLAQDYGEIATKLGLVARSTNPNQKKNIEVALQWLEETDENWLLIFDNVDSMQSISPYWPKRKGAIIVTTQNPDDIAVEATVAIPLKPFTDIDGSQFLLLQSENQQSRTKAAEEISSALGGLPMAIAHVTGYLRQTQCSLDQFLSQYQSRKLSSRIDSITNNILTRQYGRTLDTVWEIAFKDLSAESRDFLDVLAFLSPDSVPEQALICDDQESDISAADTCWSREDVDEIVRNLRKRSLISRDNGLVSIHRQLQRNLLHSLDRDLGRRDSIFLRALRTVRRVFPRQPPINEHMSEFWSICEMYLPQVLSLHSVFVNSYPQLAGSLEFAALLCDSGQYMWERNLSESAIAVLNLAKRICDDTLPAGEPHPLVATILSVQSSVELDSGFSGLGRATPLKQKVREIRQAYIEGLRFNGNEPQLEDDITLANASNNLGCCYLHSGQFKRAEPLFLESLKIKSRWGTQESMAYEFAESRKNLAIVKASQGRMKEALRMAAEAAELVATEMGPESSRTYFFHFIHAYILFDSGKVKEALSLHLKVLNFRVENLGDQHTYTAASYYAVGSIYHYQRHLDEAEINLREALKIWGQSHSNNERVARSKYRLSLVLKALKKVDEATRLGDEAWATRVQLQGGQNNDKETMETYDSLVSFWNGRSVVKEQELGKLKNLEHYLRDFIRFKHLLRFY